MDLGQQQSVSRVEVAWGWGGLPKAYSVDVPADGARSETVLTAKQQTEPSETIRFPALRARYVRLIIERSDSAYTLTELGLYQ